MENKKQISTGMNDLDNILNFLHIGDNVVWNSPSVEEYKTFVTPYVDEAIKNGNTVHYIRFAEHPPLLEEKDGIMFHNLDATEGLESFSKEIHDHIARAGKGAYFVFDCLTDLLNKWATGNMIANLFLVTCPYLYKMEAMAYFGILRNSHAFSTINKIKDTTQVYISIYNYDGNNYVHPQKVFERSSPTMFLPHRMHEDGLFHPVANSIEATNLYYSICSVNTTSHKKLDAWDRMVLRAKEASESGSAEEQAEVLDKLCRAIIGRDERMLKLVKKHFTLRDLLAIKSRMIGTGFIGGKAVGMLLSRKILENAKDFDWFPLTEPHDSYFVGSDVFHTYIIHNGWWDLYMEHRTDEGYFYAGERLETLMLEGEFPSEIEDHFKAMLDYFGQYPIVVRSSSILEDGFGNAFAGKYESFFCSIQGSPKTRYKEFLNNLRRVYSSAMCHDALEYRKKKGLAKVDEQMGLLIQRVSGSFHGYYYYPNAAGVGLSYNTYVWHDDIDPEAGMLRLVAGLGTRAVNRVKDDYPRIVALNAPEIVPVNDANDLKKFSQRDLDVLDTRVSGKNAVSLYQLYDKDFPFDLNKIAIHDRVAERMLEERGRPRKDIWILTFDRLLKTEFPQVMQKLMHTIEAEYEYPVDIEFTINFTNDGFQISLVQCRPHQTSIISDDDNDSDIKDLSEFKPLFESKSNFMGGNVLMKLQQVIYVEPAAYVELDERQKYAVARAIRSINKGIEQCKRHTLLLGPGRWGTSTPSLGVPVNFSDISQMSAIGEIEFAEGGLMPELSFGSHFFQDLVESNIFFMALFPSSFDCTFSKETFAPFKDVFAEAVPDMEELQGVVKVYRFDEDFLLLNSEIKSQELKILKK